MFYGIDLTSRGDYTLFWLMAHGVVLVYAQIHPKPTVCYALSMVTSTYSLSLAYL